MIAIVVCKSCSFQLQDIQDRESEAFLRLEERLKAALTPKYHKLFMQIGRNDGGVKFLVDMRADILVGCDFIP
jgi:malonyl-CoA decarboxylase